MSEVYAIKEIKDIEKIKNYLRKKDNQRDYTLFVVGINIGLRASDLLNLKIKDVYTPDGEVKEQFEVMEQKTEHTRKHNKPRIIKVNASVIDALERYYKTLADKDADAYIFQSRKGADKLEVRSLNRLVKEWCEACHLKGNYGTHTLRKTFGYHKYTNNANNPRILHILMKTFGHSSESVTLAYIGIDQTEINALYDDVCL